MPDCVRRFVWRQCHGFATALAPDSYGAAALQTGGVTIVETAMSRACARSWAGRRKRLPPSGRARTPTRPVAAVTQSQYTAPMKSAVIPQIRVEPELRAELESVLRQGETLTDFVEATVRDAIAFRRVETAFHARAQAASEEYHRTGVSVPVEPVLERLQSRLDAKRKKLGR